MNGYDHQLIVAFESRMADIMRKAIQKHGGIPLISPSMKEVPLENHVEAISFGEKLIKGDVHLLILLTGVGFKLLMDILQKKYAEDDLLRALAKTIIVCRGPKPAAVLRDLKLKADIMIPEPNTWREIIEALREQPLQGRTVAIQEYGISNDELVNQLREQEAEVLRIPIYRWELPDDLKPLHEAIDVIASNKASMVLFTTGVQIHHLLRVANTVHKEEALRKGLFKTIVASIGPTCTEALQKASVRVDFEPSHPKLGHLVSESAKFYERERDINNDVF